MNGRPSRHRIGAGLVLIFVAVVALNLLGLLRYPGGPLRHPSSDGLLWLDMRPSNQGSSGVTLGQPSDWAKAGRLIYYGVLALHNEWPWGATVEAITAVDPTPGLVVEAAYVSRPGVPFGGGVGPEPILPPGQTLDQALATLPAPVEPSGPGHERDAMTLVVVRADQPGPIGFSALAVDYRVGPFAFHTVEHVSLGGCVGPVPSGMVCPSE